MAAARSRSALHNMELRTTEDLHTFCTGWHNMLREDCYHLEMAAAELYGRLSKAKGLEKFAARFKARQIRRRAMRLAGLCSAASDEAARLWTVYLREYAEQIEPAKRRGGRDDWKFRERTGS